MAKTTQKISISLTAKEVGEILRKALIDKFAPNSTISLDFIIETKYANSGDESGSDYIKEVVVTGTTESQCFW